MSTLLNAAISIGPVVLVLGLMAAIACLAVQFFAPDRHRLWRRALVTLGIGTLGFVVGAGVGIAFFCSTSSAGNLCGLGGVFGTGPLAAGLCLGGQSVLSMWNRRDGS
jgi:hypothetical protein